MDSTATKINYKADFEAVARGVVSEICFAAKQGKEQTLEKMLDIWNELKKKDLVENALKHVDIKLENKEGKPLAHIVAEEGYTYLIKLLYEKDVELDGKYKDQTPSELAMSNGHEECAKEFDEYVERDKQYAAKQKDGFYEDALSQMKGTLEINGFHKLY